jgi:hypothetical protein
MHDHQARGMRGWQKLFFVDIYIKSETQCKHKHVRNHMLIDRCVYNFYLFGRLRHTALVMVGGTVQYRTGYCGPKVEKARPNQTQVNFFFSP